MGTLTGPDYGVAHKNNPPNVLDYLTTLSTFSIDFAMGRVTLGGDVPPKAVVVYHGSKGNDSGVVSPKAVVHHGLQDGYDTGNDSGSDAPVSTGASVEHTRKVLTDVWPHMDKAIGDLIDWRAYLSPDMAAAIRKALSFPETNAIRRAVMKRLAAAPYAWIPLAVAMGSGRGHVVSFKDGAYRLHLFGQVHGILPDVAGMVRLSSGDLVDVIVTDTSFVDGSFVVKLRPNRQTLILGSQVDLLLARTADGWPCARMMDGYIAPLAHKLSGCLAAAKALQQLLATPFMWTTYGFRTLPSGTTKAVVTSSQKCHKSQRLQLQLILPAAYGKVTMRHFVLAKDAAAFAVGVTVSCDAVGPHARNDWVVVA